MFISCMSNGKQWLRRYVMEPLLIARECFDHAKLDTNVVGWVEPDPQRRNDPGSARIPYPDQEDGIVLRKSAVDYTKWTLTNDHTLVGALRTQLAEHLLERQTSEEEVTDWDSAGIELISPTFELEKKDEAISQVGMYLDALDGERCTILESVWTSTHVHFGFNFVKPTDMPILLLQHLAYILVLHEDLLSQCHPRSRCGAQVKKADTQEPEVDMMDDGEIDFDEDFDPDAPWPESPPPPTEEELGMENEAVVLGFEAEFTGVGNVDSNAQYLRSRLPSHDQQSQEIAIREWIFQEDGDIFDLVELLQRPKDPSDPQGHRHRGYMYNFANLWALARNDTPWKPIKPTVEFRQHAGTRDAETVGHWVTLVEAIVKTAERKANQQTPSSSSGSLGTSTTFAKREASKYPSATTTALPWPCESMRDFCVFLGLDEMEGEYWQGRFERYKDDRPRQSTHDEI
jgi:hypothetical protein